MFTLKLYKILHVVGIALVLAAMGATLSHVLNGGSKEADKARGLIGGSFAGGMLLILLGGFGMLAKLDVGFPWWIGAKVVIWISVGGLFTVARRMPALAKTLWWSLPALIALAAWLAGGLPALVEGG